MSTPNWTGRPAEPQVGLEVGRRNFLHLAGRVSRGVMSGHRCAAVRAADPRVDKTFPKANQSIPGRSASTTDVGSSPSWRTSMSEDPRPFAAASRTLCWGGPVRGRQGASSACMPRRWPAGAFITIAQNPPTSEERGQPHDTASQKRSSMTSERRFRLPWRAVPSRPRADRRARRGAVAGSGWRRRRVESANQGGPHGHM